MQGRRPAGDGWAELYTDGPSKDWLVSFLLVSVRQGNLRERELLNRAGTLGVKGEDLQSVSRTLRRLEERGLLLRRPTPSGDGGKPYFELTDFGEAHLESWAGILKETGEPEENGSYGLRNGESRNGESPEVVSGEGWPADSAEPAPGAVFVVSGYGRRADPAADSGGEKFLGYAPEELFSWKDALERVHPEEVSRLEAAVAGVRGRPGASLSLRLRLRDAAGSWRPVEAVVQNVAPVELSGGTMLHADLLVVNLRDVSRIVAREERLAYRALHDPLTGLPNRNLFVDRLEHALARRERHGGELAVIFVDLDDFKAVNDSWGHEAGDEFLREVAGVLGSGLRPEDTAARIGGDEFVVLLESDGGIGDALRGAVRISRRVIRGLTDASLRALRNGGREPPVMPSLGIALTEDGLQTPDGLMRAADLAMYRAKSTGKGRYEIYEKSLSEEVLSRLELEKDLRRAVADPAAEFRLLYRPKVALATGRIAGVEAAPRWDHPERGPLSPADFVPLAAETGLLPGLERWVLEEACRRGEELRKPYRDGEPWSVSVNLSARYLQSPEVGRDVAAVLSGSGLPAANLSLRVAESALAEETFAADALGSLRSLGVRVEISGFGSGHSSLESLARFPADALKISGYLTGPSKAGNRANAAIASAVVSLAGELGLAVIGDGIDTPGQLVKLRAMGCDFGQGHLFSGLLDDWEMETLLSKDPRW